MEAAVASTFVRAVWVGVPVLVADQAIKLASRADVPLCTAAVAECARASVAGPLATTSIGQVGGVLGLAHGGGLWALLGLIALALIPFYAHQARPGSWAIPLALGLQLAGALAMLLDWLLIGDVTVPLLVNHAPLLNPAESALVLGAAIALLDQLAVLATRRGACQMARAIWSYGRPGAACGGFGTIS